MAVDSDFKQALVAIEGKLDNLLREHLTLQKECQDLRQQRQQWTAEKEQMLEKNNLAQRRVEALITRLKTTQSDAQSSGRETGQIVG